MQLQSPLSSQDFLSHSVYSRLLEKKIGDTALASMKQAPSEGEAVSVSLSQVFPNLTEEVTPTESKSKLKNDFDLEHFQRLMVEMVCVLKMSRQMFWNCLPLQMKKNGPGLKPINSQGDYSGSGYFSQTHA